MEYLCNMDGCEIFGSVPENPYWQMTRREYAKIKKSVPNDYKFIWTDLYSLPKHIGRKKYDIIYLSNIVQYESDNNQVRKITDKMQSHLNPNGVIVLDSLNPMYSGEYDFLENTSRDVVFNAKACSVFIKTR